MSTLAEPFLGGDRPMPSLSKTEEEGAKPLDATPGRGQGQEPFLGGDRPMSLLSKTEEEGAKPWMRPQVEAKGKQTSRLEPPNQKNTFDGATDPYHRSPQKKRERRTNRLEPHNLSTVYAKSRQVSQQEIESVRYVRKSVS